MEENNNKKRKATSPLRNPVNQHETPPTMRSIDTTSGHGLHTTGTSATNLPNAAHHGNTVPASTRFLWTAINVPGAPSSGVTVHHPLPSSQTTQPTNISEERSMTGASTHQNLMPATTSGPNLTPRDIAAIEDEFGVYIINTAEGTWSGTLPSEDDPAMQDQFPPQAQLAFQQLQRRQTLAADQQRQYEQQRQSIMEYVNRATTHIADPAERKQEHDKIFAEELECMIEEERRKADQRAYLARITHQTGQASTAPAQQQTTPSSPQPDPIKHRETLMDVLQQLNQERIDNGSELNLERLGRFTAMTCAYPDCPLLGNYMPWGFYITTNHPETADDGSSYCLQCLEELWEDAAGIPATDSQGLVAAIKAGTSLSAEERAVIGRWKEVPAGKKLSEVLGL